MIIKEIRTHSSKLSTTKKEGRTMKPSSAITKTLFKLVVKTLGNNLLNWALPQSWFQTPQNQIRMQKLFQVPSTTLKQLGSSIKTDIESQGITLLLEISVRKTWKGKASTLILIELRIPWSQMNTYSNRKVYPLQRRMLEVRDRVP